jgi:hypothetical protein
LSEADESSFAINPAAFLQIKDLRFADRSALVLQRGDKFEGDRSFCGDEKNPSA